jgi:hypothetical protein
LRKRFSDRDRNEKIGWRLKPAVNISQQENGVKETVVGDNSENKKEESRFQFNETGSLK